MKIFFDSSVLIAALFSPTGGSAKLLYYCEMEVAEGYVSTEVVDEVKTVLFRKFPTASSLFNSLLKNANLRTVKKTPPVLKKEAKNWIKDSNDAHVLASAKFAKVDVLVTLDVRDFIKNTDVSRLSGLTIMMPGELLENM